MKNRVIALADGNNFFAGCEILRNPGLRGKPVCVLSNNDGCVIARSSEAKKLGIAMGMPYFIAKKNFPDAVYLSANFALYHDLSERMIEFLKNYSDKTDVYSIDEAFFDITGLDKIYNLDYESIGKKIKDEIEDATGVSVSVGIAPTKTLAKLAAEKAKKSCGYKYINKEKILFELDKLPLEDIWGIGKNLSRTLKKYGIFYADEILSKDDDFYRNILGKKGLELKYELSGHCVIPVSGIREKPKSIQRTRAFPEFSKDKCYIKTELNMHISNVCKKLRSEKLKASVIGVMLRTKDFRVFYIDVGFAPAVDSDIRFIRAVNKLFDKIFDPNITYRSSGIYAGGLMPAQTAQISFFKNENEEKFERVSEAIDKIVEKYGKDSVSHGESALKTVLEKHKRKAELRLI